MVTKNAANADLRIKSGKPRGTSGGGSPKIMRPGSTLQMKDKPRGANGGGSPKVMEPASTLQMKDKPRGTNGGGSPKVMEPNDIPLSKEKPRIPRGGGSPKIAAVLNLYGNDYIRQASQKPDQKLDLIKTALLCYEQALEQDPKDPGLLVNLAIANLLIGDTPGAENQFVDAFKQSQQDFQKLFALLSLKYDHNKFAEETPLSVVEKVLRTTIKNCVEKDGAPTPKTPNQSVLGESSPTGTQGITAEEAKEFLYIKTIDSEKE
ncbi:tetratricopeptide repeat protein [candidate division KSB1 bacterium]|nr:tetratricopeptide repeat protein [candidate division KSB1 bacterium]